MCGQHHGRGPSRIYVGKLVSPERSFKQKVWVHNSKLELNYKFTTHATDERHRASLDVLRGRTGARHSFILITYIHASEIPSIESATHLCNL